MSILAILKETAHKAYAKSIETGKKTTSTSACIIIDISGFYNDISDFLFSFQMYDITQPSSGESTESHVTELEVDDVSLPGLCGIGLLQMCPHIESVKLVFRQQRATFKVLQHLTLPGLTELCLQVRAEGHHVLSCSRWMCGCQYCNRTLPTAHQVKPHWHYFHNWNESVKTILGSIRQHNTLKTIR